MSETPSRESEHVEEARSAFRYGVQIANEEILKILLVATLAHADTLDERQTALNAFRGRVAQGVKERLTEAGCASDGIEAESAKDIVTSVFDTITL